MKKVFLCLQHDGNNVSLHSNSSKTKTNPPPKKKTFFSYTLKYTFNWTTAEQIEMGHHQWNGVLKMYRCMLWHSFMKIIDMQKSPPPPPTPPPPPPPPTPQKKKKKALIHVCINIICNANGHKCAFIYRREMLIYHSWKNTKMPKIVEVHCGHARYFAEW